MEWLLSYAVSLQGQFFDPGKRLFIGYLASALLIAVFWIIFVLRRRPLAALTEVFSPKIWFSKSSQLDLKLFLINRLVFSIIRPALFTQLALAGAIFIALHDISTLPKGYFEKAPAWVGCGVFSVFLFLLDDFTRYFLHRLLHRWPILWAFHKLHHSAETMTPLTIMRTHPIEGVLFATRSAFVQGISIGSFVFLFGDKATLATVFGVNAAVFAFHVLGSNLRHSHVWIAYPAWLEHLLISPAQHQIHHSDDRAHFDRNFGVVLSIWDWLGGSLHLSHNVSNKVSFGLGNGMKHVHKTLVDAYVAPFLDVWKIVSGLSSNARKTSEDRHAASEPAGSESEDIRRLPGRQRYRHGEGGLI